MKKMDPAEFQELIEKCLEGVASAEEETAVVEAARGSPERHAILMRQTGCDAALRVLRRQPDSFADRTLARITRKEATGLFAQRVKDRLRTDGVRWPRWLGKRWLPPLAAGLLAAAGIGGWLVTRERRPAAGLDAARAVVLTEMSGAVEWRDAQGNVKPLKPGDVIETGLLVTGKDGWARVTMRDRREGPHTARESWVAVYETSRVECHVSEVGSRVVLDAGRLFAFVGKTRPEKPFAVRTPLAEVTAIGTRFEVRMEGARTRVEVYEGQVRIVRATDGAARDAEEGTLVWVEEGGEMFDEVLFDDEKGRTHMDGPVLFVENFEGDLSAWYGKMVKPATPEALVMTSEGGDTNWTSYTRIEEVAMRGRPSRALVVATPQAVGLSCRRDFTGSFSFEYDFCTLAPKPGGFFNDVQWSAQDHLSAPMTTVWSLPKRSLPSPTRVRVEHHVLSSRGNETGLRTRRFIDGTLVQVMKSDAPLSPRVGFLVQESEVAIDNVVVRRLYTLPAPSRPLARPARDAETDTSGGKDSP